MTYGWDSYESVPVPPVERLNEPGCVVKVTPEILNYLGFDEVNPNPKLPNFLLRNKSLYMVDKLGRQEFVCHYTAQPPTLERLWLLMAGVRFEPVSDDHLGRVLYHD